MSSPLASPSPSTRPAAGSPPLFSCTHRAESRGSIRLILAGELDLAARPHFQLALSDAQSDGRRVILDLRALTLIDCASLSVVFDAAAEARRTGTALILRDPRGQIRRILDLIGSPDGVAVVESSDSEPNLAC